MSVQLMPMSSSVSKGSKTLVWSTGDNAATLPASSGSSEARAAKGIGVIVALFVVSWLPLYTINTMLFFCPDCHIPWPSAVADLLLGVTVAINRGHRS